MARCGLFALVLLLVVLVGVVVSDEFQAEGLHASTKGLQVPDALGPSVGRGPARAYNSSQLGSATQDAADRLVDTISAPIWPTDTITTTAYLPLLAQGFQSGNDGSWVTILEESFEGSFPGPWLVEDRWPGAGEFTWGQRTCRAFAGSHSAWAVGGGTDGQELGCGSNYPDHAYAWMRYGPFSLVGATKAEVIFQRWHASESQHDSLQWLASANASEYYGWKVWGHSGGWKQTVFDLTTVPTLGNLAGEPSVWLLLVFESNETSNYAEGAYVDSLVLHKFVPLSEPSGAMGRSKSEGAPTSEASQLIEARVPLP